MNVNVSEITEFRVREIAGDRGQEPADFAGTLLEERMDEFANQTKPRKTLADLAGMFSGGDGNTAENASEILRAGIKKESGFGG